ncbi:MAG: transposase [Pseudomonadota bacterium]|nr:transposase [Pseudomonadota bacterium]
MPRHPRVHLDGIPLHIVQRGHHREPCFFGEEDYLTYLHWLGEALKETRCSLHAYALMSTHVHLLLTPKRAAAVSKLIISADATCSISTGSLGVRARSGRAATSPHSSRRRRICSPACVTSN